jgi:restriction endonuclease S subunit
MSTYAKRTPVRLADLAKGGLFCDGDWVESKDQDPNGTIRLLQLADIGDGDFRDKSSRWLRPDQAESIGVTYVEEGDILIARMPDPLGRACIVPKLATPAITAVDVAILRIKREDVDPRWLMWWLNSPETRSIVASLASGTTRQRITRKNLETLELHLPPLEEQKRIVEALDDHLSRLDKALAEVEHGRAKERLFKRSLLHSLFENLEADVLELGEVSKPKYGKDVPKHLRGDSFTYPVVGSAGVMTYTEVPLVTEPSVLVGRKGNVGAVQMFPNPCSPVDTAYYLVCPDDVDLEFMYFQLESIDLKALDSSTTIPSLRRQDLEAVPFRKPNLATQKKIAEEIKVKLASVDTALDELSNIAASLSVLRRSLLNAAFTGALLKVVR